MHSICDEEYQLPVRVRCNFNIKQLVKLYNFVNHKIKKYKKVYTLFTERTCRGPTKIGSFCASPRVTHSYLPAAGRDCRLVSLASESVAYCCHNLGEKIEPRRTEYKYIYYFNDA